MDNFSSKMRLRNRVENASMISLSDENINAIVAGTKTQARFLFDHGGGFGPGPNGEKEWPHELPKGAPSWMNSPFDTIPKPCPYGAQGDFLWVQGLSRHRTNQEASTSIFQRFKWLPPNFIHRNNIRALLELVAVRPERLQSITEEDAKAEGITPFSITVRRPSENSAKEYVDTEPDAHRRQFQALYEPASIPAFSWEKNPRVWVLIFRQVTPGEFVDMISSV